MVKNMWGEKMNSEMTRYAILTTRERKKIKWKKESLLIM